MTTKHAKTAAPARQFGVGLVELMVALIIGLFLILGAVTIYSQSRKTFRTTEAVARLQENARYALDVMEPDVRMASYWGLANRPDYIINRAAPTADTPADLSAAETLIDECGNNWLINLEQFIEGWNGNGATAFGLGCDAFQDDWRPDTDILVVRRGGENQPATLVNTRLYLQTSRIQGTIFRHASTTCTDPKNPACIPADYSPPASETRELMTTAYYIANSSTARGDVPSLRRKRLVAGAILDEEVVSGVEDLQVRFAVDTTGDMNADAYVDPEANPADYGGPIVAATIWLRIRAEEPEFGFADDNAYVYADVNQAASNDNFRRIVVSKTIQLRNTPRT